MKGSDLPDAALFHLDTFQRSAGIKEVEMKAIAPGKLIISGEHSVLYGMPAIAMAVQRQARAALRNSRERSPRRIFFELMNYGQTQSVTVRELRKIRDTILSKHEQFMKGQISLKEILLRPFDLFNYVVIRLVETFHIKLTKGLRVCLDSNIPIGCGMGSSAATLLSLLHLLAHYFGLERQLSRFVKFGLEAEGFQHLRSSGVDLYTSINGGCIHFQGGTIRARLPLLKEHVYTVHTGGPESTTAECVNHSASYFKQSKSLAKDFGAVTAGVAAALEAANFEQLQALVRENHRLLKGISIVPERVGRFISEVEARGGAAKICGAGAVRGDKGGIVLVLAEESPEDMCRRYDYTCEPLQGDPLGVRMHL